jgi:hypothetical protein
LRVAYWPCAGTGGVLADVVFNLVSVTIAPRTPAPGVLLFVVTLTTHQDVRSYPCRTLEKATALAARFIAGVTRPARRPEADTNPDRYDGPPRTAEQVAA